MIRYKDKIFEDYFIDPVTAVITDKNGVAQKIILHQGRKEFKQMHVHCIMMHTFCGYRPGFLVHHLDENPLNNALSNLVYMTREEHLSCHHKREHLSKETRAKLSDANKGENNPMFGKNVSKETRDKLAVVTKGTRWWHRLSGEERRTKDCPGEGWYLGRNKQWYR